MCFYAFCAIFPSFGKPDKRVLKIQANNVAQGIQQLRGQKEGEGVSKNLRLSTQGGGVP